MKVNITPKLSQELITQIDGLTHYSKNHSLFFEEAAWLYLQKLDRQERDLKDIAIYEKKAVQLNKEALENLAYLT